MKNSKWTMLSGISLILIAVFLYSVYESISKSNISEYAFSNKLFKAGLIHIDTVKLQGENEVSISIFVEPIGTPIQVTLQTKDGEKVGAFTSEKNHAYKILENPYSQGNFEVITSNLGDESASIVVNVRDLKQPGTYIDTPTAWWILTHPTTIIFWIGLLTLMIGVVMYFDEQRKKDKISTT